MPSPTTGSPSTPAGTRRSWAWKLQELDALGVDLASLGFAPAELNDLLGSKAGNTDPDDVPEPPKTPVSKLGDLWLLGAHVTCPKCNKDTKLENAVRR